jgi:hypothetical protein
MSLKVTSLPSIPQVCERMAYEGTSSPWKSVKVTSSRLFGFKRRITVVKAGAGLKGPACAVRVERNTSTVNANVLRYLCTEYYCKWNFGCKGGAA